MITLYIFVCFLYMAIIPTIIVKIIAKAKKEEHYGLANERETFVYGFVPVVLVSIILITTSITSCIQQKNIDNSNYTALISNQFISTTPNNDIDIDIDYGDYYDEPPENTISTIVSADINSRDDKRMNCIIKTSKGKFVKDLGFAEGERVNDDYIFFMWDWDILPNERDKSYIVYVYGYGQLAGEEIYIE